MLLICLLFCGDLAWKGGPFLEAIDGFGYEPWAYGARVQLDYKDRFEFTSGITMLDKVAYGPQTDYTTEFRVFFGQRYVAGGTWDRVEFRNIGHRRRVYSGLFGAVFDDLTVLAHFRDDSAYQTWGVSLQKDFEKCRAVLKVKQAQTDEGKISGVFLGLTYWVF